MPNTTNTPKPIASRHIVPEKSYFYSKKEEDEDKIVYLDERGRRHRTDGPALVWKDTEKEEHYVEGMRHNENGPAVIEKDGSYIHYKFGVKHREDGPAVYRKSSNEYEYWLHGQQYNKEEFERLSEELSSDANISQPVRRITRTGRKQDWNDALGTTTMVFEPARADFSKMGFWGRQKMKLGYWLYRLILWSSRQYQGYIAAVMRERRISYPCLNATEFGRDKTEKEKEEDRNGRKEMREDFKRKFEQEKN